MVGGSVVDSEGFGMFFGLFEVLRVKPKVTLDIFSYELLAKLLFE